MNVDYVLCNKLDISPSIYLQIFNTITHIPVESSNYCPSYFVLTKQFRCHGFLLYLLLGHNNVGVFNLYPLNVLIMVHLRLKIRTCISPIFTHQTSSQAKSTKRFAMTWKFLGLYASFFSFTMFVCLFVLEEDGGTYDYISLEIA